MKQNISNDNFKVKKTEEERQSTYGCNCTRAMGPCPLGGKCLVNSVVYKAEVVENNSTFNTYTGLTSNTFKDRYYGNRHSFKKRDSNHSTTLSSHIWDLNNKNENYEVHWSIFERAKEFNLDTQNVDCASKKNTTSFSSLRGQI